MHAVVWWRFLMFVLLGYEIGCEGPRRCSRVVKVPGGHGLYDAGRTHLDVHLKMSTTAN